MARHLVQADRKDTVMLYNRGEKQSILECTKHQNLRGVSYNS